MLLASLALFGPGSVPDVSPAAGPAHTLTLPRIYQGDARLSGAMPPGLGVERLEDEDLPHLPLV
ncbi:MAG: hypothetical protein FJ318_10365, partial [SAR202 cluster bacterium]|nr:hypothetical protein [SAR202 cluster bacterium]